MKAVEAANEDLRDILPKTYTHLANRSLVELLKLMSSIPMDIEGDAFGKVYEYFLGKFAMSEGQKGGEFFTPTALVRLIVEIIEPFHGRILDPACGSGGMFVQSARFVGNHKNGEGQALSVEGLNKSAIARVKRIAWNTVDRWLERAAGSCHRFNARRITGLAVEELQADEIRTIVGGKQQPIWIFAVIDVWSRLWPSTVVGRRSYRNTLTLFRDVANRMNIARFQLIATDGFEFYERVVRRVFGPACLYGQVIKMRRNDRVIRVERRTRIGAAWRWEQALADSEDSEKLNTSFIERLNLTIRQGSAYLSRRTICYARLTERLTAHLELLRCYYNFVRPHRALKFGREVRTPAIQAGLTKRRLTLREIFSSTILLLAWEKVKSVFARFTIWVIAGDRRVQLAA
jgi:IS1 family transposase